jgi:exonuclease SbcC
VTFRFEVVVSLKPGLLDPQGKAVEGSLPAMGWTNVRDVRVGKVVELTVDAPDEELEPLAERRPEGETELVLARRIFADGRTRAYAWGRAAAREDVAAAAERLIAMSGQFEQRRLARPSYQLDVLDVFAGPEQARRRVAAREAWRVLAAARRRHAEVTQNAAVEEERIARTLGNLLRSNQFPAWLEAAALDSLVVAASASLTQLSGGQYELTHEGGDFFVVDHADADATRSVRTLSGGETFQASLSLALALSSQLGAMAAEGATKLESIFLDEGFGTLDEATLDVVASTLENLAATGSRMVGVITHVPALAERVPVRFQVTRDGSGSHIHREGA